MKPSLYHKIEGFTVIELLILITVFLVTMVGTWYLLDPFELKRRGDDSMRLADLAMLQQAVNRAAMDATASGNLVLCSDKATSCEGKSSQVSDSVRKSDGTGWVKVDLSSQKSVLIPTLPVDPVNDEKLNYQYFSDGVSWEITTTLESKLYRSKMINDGGDDPNKYEVGTNLTLGH